MRYDYELSMSLIKEAEALIKESQILLNDLSKIKDNNHYDNETAALRDKILRLEKQNNCLYMENVFLKSRLQELTVLNDRPYKSILLDYQNKTK